MNLWITRWRQFLEEHPSFAISSPVKELSVPSQTSIELAQNESFWQTVQAHYPKPSSLTNLNSGAVSSSPLIVEKAFVDYYRLANQIPSYYLFKAMEEGREIIREGLAGLVNSSPNEIAILRNTTETLNNLIFGIELKPGDEVVACNLDYSKAVSSWKQRELREGIRMVWVKLEGASESDEEVIVKYVAAFSDRTKLLHLTHVINWNGQTLPIEAIIREAKKRNIAVLLDGAHSFGLLEIDVQALDCDYFVTALHKWLSGPIPTGLLYIRQDRISSVWPLASSFIPQSDNIRKFEELSIQLLPHILGLGFAIAFYWQLGRKNKEQRLRHLPRFWTSQLADHEAFSFKTPTEELRCCVIVNMSLAGWEPATLEKELLHRHQIHVTTVGWENMQGIRVTPNVYTHPEDLQRFVDVLKQLHG